MGENFGKSVEIGSAIKGKSDSMKTQTQKKGQKKKVNKGQLKIKRVSTHGTAPIKQKIHKKNLMKTKKFGPHRSSLKGGTRGGGFGEGGEGGTKNSYRKR